jgi:drug/metabolite transporter (DMT)-like permease
MAATSQTPQQTSSDRRALVAASVTVVAWASAFVAIRSAGAHFSPGALAFGRLFAGSITLGVILAVRREGLPPRAAWPGILGSGVLWFGGYMVALNWGEQLVDAGTASMVVNIGPVLITLLGGWLLKERIAPRVLVGMGVSFVGVVLVSLSGDGHASVLGVALCVGAAVTYAFGVISQKTALRHASAFQVTTFGCLIGMVCCLPFAGRFVGQLTAAPLSATLNVVYLGVVPTALAFTTWAYALSRTTAGRMGATTYAVPAIVVLLSWAVLGELPGWLTFAGGALCLAGVAVSRARGRRGPPAAPPSTSTPSVGAPPAAAPAAGEHID